MNDYSNPFDVPLNYEIEESRQRQQASQAASGNGNPFDEPLASEVAEGSHAEAKKSISDKGNPFDVPLDSEIAEQKEAEAKKANPEQYASDTRQMLVSGLTGMPSPNMNERDRASFETGKAAGAGTATLLSAAPLIGALAPHIPDLDKAWKIAATLMGGSATVDHVIHVLKTLKGK